MQDTISISSQLKGNIIFGGRFSRNNFLKDEYKKNTINKHAANIKEATKPMNIDCVFFIISFLKLNFSTIIFNTSVLTAQKTWKYSYFFALF